jgi:hypothetical protein
VWGNGIYLRSDRRRPVRLRPYRAGEDLQAAAPFGWCPGCGMELYGQEEKLCRLCERWGGYETDGTTNTLPRLHTGAGCEEL